MYINSYSEYTVAICAAISGSIAYIIIGGYLYCMMNRLKILKNIVLWYGTNSLAIFPVHLTIKMMILWYMPAFSQWYVLFFIMLLFSIPVVNIITRYLPFMLGQKSSKNTL